MVALKSVAALTAGLPKCVHLLHRLLLVLPFENEDNLLTDCCSDVIQYFQDWHQFLCYNKAASLKPLSADQFQPDTVPDVLNELQNTLDEVMAVVTAYRSGDTEVAHHERTYLGQQHVSYTDYSESQLIRAFQALSIHDHPTQDLSAAQRRKNWTAQDKEMLWKILEKFRELVQKLMSCAQLRDALTAYPPAPQNSRIRFAEEKSSQSTRDNSNDCSSRGVSIQRGCSKHEGYETDFEDTYTNIEELVLQRPANARESMRVIPSLPQRKCFQEQQHPSDHMTVYLGSILEGATETWHISEAIVAAEYSRYRPHIYGTRHPDKHDPSARPPITRASKVDGCRYFQALSALILAGRRLASELHRAYEVLNSWRSGLSTHRDLLSAAQYITCAWILSLRIISRERRWACHGRSCEVWDEKQHRIEIITTMTADLRRTIKGLRTSFG